MTRTVSMLILIALSFFGGQSLLLAQRSAPSSAPSYGQKPVPQAKKKKAHERGLPAGAVLVAPDTWELKKADGSTVRYRRTPFGFMEEHAPVEGTGGPRTTASPLGMVPVSGQGIKAFAEGDLIRFEKVGPSGTLRWRRKKSELNEPERQAWEQAQAEAAKAAAQSAKSKEAK
jgi:hypothetical protein